jgi:acetyl-CoA acetyltransferase family protein
MVAKRKAPKVPKGRRPVIVAGNRTPFLRLGGVYVKLMIYDFGRHAVQGLLARSGLDPKHVETVVMGTVIQDPRTSNVAREIALGAALPQNVTAYTTTLACVSANVAATTVADQIRLGLCDVAIVGGTESFSDPPIRLSKDLRQALFEMNSAKKPADYLNIAKRLRPDDLIPDIPSASEFSTNQTMGAACERMAKRFDISRKASDEMAARSHQLAAKAWEDGIMHDEVVPVQVPPDFKTVEKDNGPRGDSTVESLGKLRPAFDKKYGIVTAGSSSFFTDGASAVLLMSAERADELGMDARAAIVDYVYDAGDPLDELLLGPAWTIPQLLDRSGLDIGDIDVWEIHEAFAAQMVANLQVLADETWCKARLGRDKAFGEIPMDKLNLWGGSLSIGHPFGATGGRLLTTAAHRLQVEGGKYAVIAGCAAGGQGSAILLENPNA